MSTPCRHCGRSKEAHDTPPFEYAALLAEQQRCWNGYSPSNAENPPPSPHPRFVIDADQFRKLVAGEVIQLGKHEVALADIGFREMAAAIKAAKESG